MYKKSVVKLIISNIEISIDFKVRVKQGDSMSPVILLFLMMDFYETLEEKWKALVPSKTQFARRYN